MSICLLSLPDDVFQGSLFTFLCLKDLVTLDSAVVSSRFRDNFHLNLGLASVEGSSSANLNSSAVTWLVSHKMKFRQMKFASGIPNSSIAQLSSSVLRHATVLNFQHCSHLTEDLNCPQLQDASRTKCVSLPKHHR